MTFRIATRAMVMVMCFGSVAAYGASIDFDRMMVVDGKRTFVLGLYENPKDDAVLKQVGDAGFNLVQAPVDAAALDRLGSFGLHGWVNTGGCIDFSDDRAGREDQMRKMVETVGGHSALMVWEVPDEALWNCWYMAMDWRRNSEPGQQNTAIAALSDKTLSEELTKMRAEADRLFKRGDIAGFDETADGIWRKLGKEPKPGMELSLSQQRQDKMCAGMREGYAALRKLDPNHPVWMNHAPRNQLDQLAAFGKATDIAGCDIYPVPEYRTGHSDLADRSLASVGAYTVRMQDSVPGKPVWMVLQGFGWADIATNPSEEDKKVNRRPDFAESRFMAYDSIVRGARGILYWGTAYIEKDSALWADLLKLVRELADLQPVLSAPDADLKIDLTFAQTWGSVDHTVQVLPKKVDGKVWLLVVNECNDPLTYTIQGLSGLDGTVYSDPADERQTRVENGRMTLAIQGHGVQVLKPE